MTKQHPRHGCKKYYYCPECDSTFVEWTPEWGWHCLVRACRWKEEKMTGPGYFMYAQGRCMTAEEIEKFENPLFYGWTEEEKDRMK